MALLLEYAQLFRRNDFSAGCASVRSLPFRRIFPEARGTAGSDLKICRQPPVFALLLQPTVSRYSRRARFVGGSGNRGQFSVFCRGDRVFVGDVTFHVNLAVYTH